MLLISAKRPGDRQFYVLLPVYSFSRLPEVLMILKGLRDQMTETEFCLSYRPISGLGVPVS